MLERILSAVNTPGARIIICLFLLIGFSIFTGAQMSHDITIFALSILGREFGAGKEKEKDPPVVGSKVEKATATLETVTSP